MMFIISLLSMDYRVSYGTLRQKQVTDFLDKDCAYGIGLKDGTNTSPVERNRGRLLFSRGGYVTNMCMSCQHG